MKLSEAIRLGAMMGPQKFGSFGDLDSGVEGTCGLGSAIAAAGLREVERVNDGSNGPLVVSSRNGSSRIIAIGEKYTAIESEWGTLLGTSHRCPADTDLCAALGLFWLGHLIPHLNDVHLWTREQIADFVESIESKPAMFDIVTAQAEVSK